MLNPISVPHINLPPMAGFPEEGVAVGPHRLGQRGVLPHRSPLSQDGSKDIRPRRRAERGLFVGHDGRSSGSYIQWPKIDIQWPNILMLATSYEVPEILIDMSIIKNHPQLMLKSGTV